MGPHGSIPASSQDAAGREKTHEACPGCPPGVRSQTRPLRRTSLRNAHSAGGPGVLLAADLLLQAEYALDASDRNVEIARRARQVEHRHTRGDAGVVSEDETLIEVVDPDPGIKLGQRCREPTEVLGPSVWRYVHVVGRLERNALRDRSERPDDDVILGREIRPGQFFRVMAANLETLRR